VTSLDLLIVTVMYLLGVGVAFCVVFPNDPGNGLGFRRDEGVALMFLWPLSLCFVIASGVVELYRRFSKGGA